MKKAPFINEPHKIMQSHYTGVNLDSAVYYKDKAYVIAQNNNYEDLSLGLLMLEAYINTLRGNISEAEALMDRLIPRAKKMNATEILGELYNEKARAKREINDYDSTLYYMEQERPLVEDDPVGLAWNYERMAIVYTETHHLTKAIEYHFKAYEIAEEAGDKSSLPIICGNIGIVYIRQKQYEKALEYFKKANQLAKEEDNTNIVIWTQLRFADVYKEQGDNETALKEYNKALEIAEKTNEPAYINMVKEEMMLHYISNDFNDTTLQIVERLFLEVHGSKSEEEMNNSYYYFLAEGMINAYKNLNTAAIRSLEKAYAIESRYGLEHSIELKDMSEELAKQYEKIGDYKNAYKYYQIFKEQNDFLINDENLVATKVKEAEFEFEMEQKIQEQKLEKAQSSVRNQTLIIIGVLLVLALMTTIAIILRRANLLKAEQNDLLEEQVQARTEELQISNKNLEQANYELRTFNYIASHDIKEPIRNIGSYASLIFRRLPDDLKNSLGDYFTTIKRNTTQLYTLIEDFARYTTLSKDESIDKQEVDLNYLVSGVEAGLETAIQKYNGTVIYQDLPTISSNNSLLYTIFKNIIENGLKYNQSDAPTVEISYEKTPTHHQISLKDNGIGIAEEYHGRIFEMFKRLHNRSEYEGSGIGLAIAKLSAGKLEGEIQLNSAEGKGSEFTVSLPL